MTPIQPLEGWVLIEPIDAENIETKSGLVLTVSNAEKEQRKNIGKVIGVPSETPVSEGCTVYYKNYAGQDCYVGEKKYLMVEFQDLLGVLKD